MLSVAVCKVLGYRHHRSGFSCKVNDTPAENPRQILGRKYSDNIRVPNTRKEHKLGNKSTRVHYRSIFFFFFAFPGKITVYDSKNDLLQVRSAIDI